MLKILIPLSYLLCIFLLVVLPAWRVYRQTGIYAIRTKNKQSVHAYVTSLVRVLFIVPLISIAFRYLAHNTYWQYLQPLTFLHHHTILLTGAAITSLAVLWVALAQYQMGQSRRIGIDDENKTALVATGLYRFSRNPIYLGILTLLLGVFLMLPDILTFAALLSSYFVINIQVRLEEDFLLQQHGDNYKAYQKQVRRWI